MEISTTILLGVLSGIGTAILLFTFGIVFKKVIKPWYERFIFKGIDLRGDWLYEKNVAEIRYQYHLSLYQNAHQIKGTMNLSKMGGERDYVQLFSCRGLDVGRLR